jgi:hypothetical protein
VLAEDEVDQGGPAEQHALKQLSRCRGPTGDTERKAEEAAAEEAAAEGSLNPPVVLPDDEDEVVAAHLLGRLPDSGASEPQLKQQQQQQQQPEHGAPSSLRLLSPPFPPPSREPTAMGSIDLPPRERDRLVDANPTRKQQDFMLQLISYAKCTRASKNLWRCVASSESQP